ncbi:MAG: hypothetical protein LBL83_10085 [Clostridiales bacterium]|jgi:hypothetical protein|nr:hypothetical protein [Clostridiales bacterium]
MSIFPKILYWKWDAGIFGRLGRGLEDCMDRFDFDLLYVSFHHLPLPLADERLLALIREASGALARRGRKLLLDIDARNELDAFLDLHPGEEGMAVYFWMRELDGRGRCRFAMPNLARGRTGRAGIPRPPAKLAGLWAMDAAGPQAQGKSQNAAGEQQEAAGEWRAASEWQETAGEWRAAATGRQAPQAQPDARQRAAPEPRPQDAAGPQRAWAYAPGSLSRLPAEAASITDLGGESLYEIDAGAAFANKRLLLAPVFAHGIPDLFSDNLDGFYRGLFDAVADLPLGGAAVDEWGWDLAMGDSDGLFYIMGAPYSDGLLRRYAAATGRCLDDDLVHFVCVPAESGLPAGEPAIPAAAAHPASAIPASPARPATAPPATAPATAPAIPAPASALAVSDYVRALRERMRENNRWFYDETKRRFGEKAFVGVHPTLWGDPSDFSMDILHNGVSWWEAPRDYAQTDECVAMPVRLALAHKWGGPVFYNMWYSGNTRQLETYWRETWANARFGGRTHYLGYECPNEPGVFRLKHPGALEGIEAMERKISELDRLQRSQPDCRALIVFGMEAATNWRLHGGWALPVRGQGLLPRILGYASALFEHFLCDLAPSTEISSGAVRIDGGSARLGTQDYDAVIFLAPEFCGRDVLERLAGYAGAGGRLLLAGGCSRCSDGLPAGEALARLRGAASACFPEIPSAMETLGWLGSQGVSANRWHNGCAYQDGSLLFTAEGHMPTGNALAVDCSHRGRAVRFTGEDYYYEAPH